MKYTVIDFETANSKRSSACALGIVVVEDGQVIEEAAWLIKPKDNYFAGMNIAIHGIRPDDVKDKPEFDVLYKDVFSKYLEGQLVLAHNASFDMSVLRACLNEYDLDFPELNYICTVKVAQKMFPNLHRHSLDVVSDFLGFTFKHHDAYDDARACANIMIQACQKTNLDPLDLCKELRIKVGRIFKNGYTPCSSRKL